MGFWNFCELVLQVSSADRWSRVADGLVQSNVSQRVGRRD